VRFRQNNTCIYLHRQEETKEKVYLFAVVVVDDVLKLYVHTCMPS
jgi:hypothetical protein